MQPSDRYGRIRPPEKMRSIRNKKSALMLIGSAYAVFRDTADEIVTSRYWYTKEHLVSAMYEDACRLFEGRSRLEIEGKKAVEFLKKKALPYDGTGLFLSAFLNNTGLTELVINEFPELDCIGYRLEKGKTIALGRDIKTYDAGYKGKGIVLNWGETSNLGHRVESGFQGNWREAITFAEKSAGGVQANWGNSPNMCLLADDGIFINFSDRKRSGNMAMGAKEGLQINVGHAYHLAQEAGGGMQINYGEVSTLADRASGGIQINCQDARSFGMDATGGRQFQMGRTDIYAHPSVLEGRQDKELMLLQRLLKSKALEMKGLGDLEGPDETSLERIRGFDYLAFQNRMEKIGRAIERHVRTKYGRQT